MRFKQKYPDAHIIQFETSRGMDSFKVRTGEIAHLIAKELAFNNLITIVKPL